MKYIFPVFIIAILSCKEVYFPELHNNDKVLVVNGLVTNKNKVHVVRLSWSKSVGENEGYLPVSSAKVFITNECSEIFYLTENSPGYYLTDSLTFIPVENDSYKLHIELENGDIYESDFQTLLPEVSFNSIKGVNGKKEFLVGDENSPLIQTYEGIETLISIPNVSNSIPKMRFNVSLIIQYAYEVNGASTSTYYCWKKVNPNLNVNITKIKYNLDASDNIQHSICFLPRSKFFWQLEHEYSCFIIQINGYRLNDQSYLFYKQAYDQLEADNSILDPIAVQLSSNIHCVSNPNKSAFGFFEVSSVNNSTYIIRDRSITEHDFINAPMFPLNIPNSGCSLDVLPSIWYTKFLN